MVLNPLRRSCWQAIVPGRRSSVKIAALLVACSLIGLPTLVHAEGTARCQALADAMDRAAKQSTVALRGVSFWAHDVDSVAMVKSAEPANNMTLTLANTSTSEPSLENDSHLFLWEVFAEEPCPKPTSATIAGRKTLAYRFIEPGDDAAELATFWIDAASGLPVRTLIDMPAESLLKLNEGLNNMVGTTADVGTAMMSGLNGLLGGLLDDNNKAELEKNVEQMHQQRAEMDRESTRMREKLRPPSPEYKRMRNVTAYVYGSPAKTGNAGGRDANVDATLDAIINAK